MNKHIIYNEGILSVTSEIKGNDVNKGGLLITDPTEICIWGRWFTMEEFDIMVEQQKPPTWDEVVKAWENTINDKLEFNNNDEGIRIIYPNGIYYLINLEQVYSNRKVFSMNVNATFYAINLTIRYLEAHRVVESK